jgi:hypothetical protein
VSAGSHMGPIAYGQGEMLDTLGESFAGPHDWLSDQIGMYDSTGNQVYRTGLAKTWYDTLSAALVPVAAPFAIAGIVDTTPGMHSLLYSNNDN